MNTDHQRTYAGAIALAHFIREFPHAVAGFDVLDICTGSGLVSDAAIAGGAGSVMVNDAEIAAVKKLYDRGHKTVCCDFSHIDPRPFDIVLAGDVWYENRLSKKVMKWQKDARRFLTSTILRPDATPHFSPKEGSGFRRLARFEIEVTDNSDPWPLLTAEIWARG